VSVPGMKCICCCCFPFRRCLSWFECRRCRCRWLFRRLPSVRAVAAIRLALAPPLLTNAHSSPPSYCEGAASTVSFACAVPVVARLSVAPQAPRDRQGSPQSASRSRQKQEQEGGRENGSAEPEKGSAHRRRVPRASHRLSPPLSPAGPAWRHCGSGGSSRGDGGGRDGTERRRARAGTGRETKGASADCR
jgi:hypothetical protein